jgi:HSP20 family molecular chaperone IbpA
LASQLLFHQDSLTQEKGAKHMKYSLDFWKPALTPAREFSALQRSINRLFEDVFPSAVHSTRDMMEFQPECDFEETENEYKLSFDLPGLKKRRYQD